MATDYLQTYLVPLAQKNYLQRSFGEASPCKIVA